MLDAIEITSVGNVTTVYITGRLGADFYAQFAARVHEQIREFGKVRILLVIEDFDGWSASGLWEELKFDFNHRHDIDRLAVVGETQRNGSMTRFCEWLTSAAIRHFNADQIEEARAWIQET